MIGKKSLGKLMRRMYWRVFVAVSLACGFAGAAYFTLDHYVERIMVSEATQRAKVWAGNLVENVSDLPAIIRGAIPADESVVFLEQARAIGDVWRFQVYGPDGRLILVSNRLGKTHQFTEMLDQQHSTALSQIQAEVASMLLRVAVVEYNEAFEYSKISNLIEYQDGFFFVKEARQIIEKLAPMLDTRDSVAHLKVKQALADLSAAWPEAVPPETSVLPVTAMQALVTIVELQLNKLN